MKTHMFFIYEIQVVLTTNNSQFENFVQAMLQNYKDGEHQNPKFKINIHIDFDQPTKISKSKFRVGNGIFLDETNEKIAFQHKLFFGEFYKQEDNCLHIRGEVCKTLKSNFIQFVKRLVIENYSHKEMLFHQLYRELILMPVFWVLRHKFEKYLMHASAVSNGKQTLVFLGNDGVGKTTVALKLLQQDNMSFFGDNFLLYDENNIYPFIDTLRVNKKDTKVIETYELSSMFKKVYEDKVRMHFNFNKDFISNSSVPTHFYVLKQADKNSKTPITTNQFINYTLAINDYVKEFDKYSFASNLIFLYEHNKNNMISNEVAALTKLVANKRCAMLSLNKNQKVFEID